MANGSESDRNRLRFSAVGGTASATGRMEALLSREHDPGFPLEQAMKIALDAWSTGSLAADKGAADEIPSPETLAQHFAETLKNATLEASVLERNSRGPICYRSLTGDELKTLVNA
jgi:hypothetical protein